MKKVTTNICVNFISEARTRWVEKDGVRVGLSSSEQPLALHSLQVSHALQYWNKDASEARVTLLNDVRI